MLNYFKGKDGPLKGFVILIALCFVGLVWTVATMGGPLGMSIFFAGFAGSQMMLYVFAYSNDNEAG